MYKCVAVNLYSCVYLMYEKESWKEHAETRNSGKVDGEAHVWSYIEGQEF